MKQPSKAAAEQKDSEALNPTPSKDHPVTPTKDSKDTTKTKEDKKKDKIKPLPPPDKKGKKETAVETQAAPLIP